MLRTVSRRLVASSGVVGASASAPVAAGLRGHLPAARRCLSDAASSSDDGAKNRRLWRWGGSAGMMGAEADAEVSKEPLLLDDVRGVTLAACGSSHSGFVVDGRLYTYGANKYNQLGRSEGDLKVPGIVPFEEGAPLVTQAALGACHSAVITEGGDLWTWGWGGSFWYGAGALGHSGRDGAATPTRVEKFVALGEKVKQVACGAQHTIVLTEEGHLYATGKGDFGRLGRGDTRDEVEFEEIDYFQQANDSILAPGETTNIVKVGAGNNYCAAMSSSGELWVWGRNDHGQLGLGEEAMGDMYSAESYPRLVRSLPSEGLRILDFTCGEHHLVVRTDSGALYEWGGRTWLEPHAVPIPEEHREALQTITKLEAGEKFSFALCADGTLFSWGSKASGCLAQGPDCPKIVVEPTPVPSSTFGHQKIVDIVASKSRCLAITVEDEFTA